MFKLYIIIEKKVFFLSSSVWPILVNHEEHDYCYCLQFITRNVKSAIKINVDQEMVIRSCNIMYHKLILKSDDISFLLLHEQSWKKSLWFLIAYINMQYDYILITLIFIVSYSIYLRPNYMKLICPKHFVTLMKNRERPFH